MKALVAGVNTNRSGTNNGAQYGACPIFNGSTAVPWIQKNMLASPPRLFDMNDVDELYDEAAATFITKAVKASTPFFWYFASHHTHVPQFSGVDHNGYTLRGLQGDSLSLLDRSVEKMLDLLATLDVADTTLTIFSADNGGARYWGPVNETRPPRTHARRRMHSLTKRAPCKPCGKTVNSATFDSAALLKQILFF